MCWITSISKWYHWCYTPAFNFNPFSPELAGFINLGCDFTAALTASATVTTATNENEIKMKNECGQDGPHSHTQPQTQQHHPTAPVIDSNAKIGPTGSGLGEINNIGCVFGGIVCENKFYDHVNDIFDDYSNENLYETILHHLVCYFEYFCIFV